MCHCTYGGFKIELQIEHITFTWTKRVQQECYSMISKAVMNDQTEFSFLEL